MLVNRYIKSILRYLLEQQQQYVSLLNVLPSYNIFRIFCHALKCVLQTILFNKRDRPVRLNCPY